jgi:hypothetical protein
MEGSIEKCFLNNNNSSLALLMNLLPLVIGVSFPAREGAVVNECGLQFPLSRLVSSSGILPSCLNTILSLAN